MLVVSQVLVNGVTRRHAWLLKFNHHPGQAIDKADQIWTTCIQRPRHAELADKQKVVVAWMLPVHHSQAFCLLPAVLAVRHGHHDAFLKQLVDLTVGSLRAHS